MEDSEADRLRHRRERDVKLQQVIDELAREHGGSGEDRIRRRLEEEVAARDLPDLPGPLLDAVAQTLSAGNPYVVSSFSEDVADVPRPQDPVDDGLAD